MDGLGADGYRRATALAGARCSGNRHSAVDAARHFDDVGDQRLGQEGEQAQAQAEEQDGGAETAGLGLLRQVPDDEEHEQHQAADQDVHHQVFELFGFHGDLAGMTGTAAGRRLYARPRAAQ